LHDTPQTMSYVSVFQAYLSVTPVTRSDDHVRVGNSVGETQ
jgi:hypothetical protein